MNNFLGMMNLCISMGVVTKLDYCLGLFLVILGFFFLRSSYRIGFFFFFFFFGGGGIIFGMPDIPDSFGG